MLHQHQQEQQNLSTNDTQTSTRKLPTTQVQKQYVKSEYHLVEDRSQNIDLIIK